MSNNFIKIAIGALLLGGVVGGVTLFLLKDDADTTGGTSTTPTTFPTSTGSGNTTPTPLDIERILERPETVDVGSGNYVIAGGNDIMSIPPYQILYYAPDGSYTISLQGEPLGDVRRAAEEAFLTLLGVTEEEACREKVMLTVPFEVNARLAGKDLGLSFCAGSVQF